MHIGPNKVTDAGPSEREIAERNSERAAQNRERFIQRPFRRLISCLDRYNGAVTAAATAAIAALTWSLSVDSSHQADTANKQFAVMKGQLAEMESTSRQTDDLIAANKKLAEAAAKQAEAASEANMINRESIRIAQQAQVALVEAQRANIAYKTVNLSFTTENEIPTEHWIPIWINEGNTQASRVRLGTHCMTSNHMIIDPFDLSRVPVPSEGSASPKEEVIGPGCHAKAEVVDAARKGSSFFYFFGDAQYFDIYGTEHLTEFCGRLPGDVISSDKSFLSQCSKHNCADRDCPDFKRQ